MAGGFRTKRVYDDASPEDGLRILVDRLWPRGISKERAQLDSWAKDAAPSAELRQWFHSAPQSQRDQHDRQEEFAARYVAELEGPAQQRQLDELRAQAAERIVTLLTANKDVEHSHVAILLRELER